MDNVVLDMRKVLMLVEIQSHQIKDRSLPIMVARMSLGRGGRAQPDSQTETAFPLQCQIVASGTKLVSPEVSTRALSKSIRKENILEGVGTPDGHSVSRAW